jgi:hypothetical protein
LPTQKNWFINDGQKKLKCQLGWNIVLKYGCGGRFNWLNVPKVNWKLLQIK